MVYSLILYYQCLNRILHRSVTAHDAQTPGALSNAITIHCNSIQSALSDRIGIMIQAFAMLLASFAVAFSQSWHLTLVMLGLVFLTLGLIGFIVGSDQKIEAGLLKRYADCSAIAEDALGSIKTVIAFGAAPKFLAKYEAILDQAQADGKKRGPFVGLMFACQYFFMFTGWAIGFYLGAYLYKHGKITDPGRILSYVCFPARLYSPLLTVTQRFFRHVDWLGSHYGFGSQHALLHQGRRCLWRCFQDPR